jgi:cellulose synthase/poly-beta-1,6-N-acetylglucosamine synthase-like glycosyltransferase
MTSLIILLLVIIFYTYFGYLFFIVLLGLIRNKAINKGDIFPEVAFVIAAYNEEKGIREKIENSLAINYPNIHIYIVSDASSDNTDNIVSEYKNTKLIRVEGRVGKTEARNIALRSLTEEIIVFSDATTSYEPNAVTELVNNFNDKSIGMVSGHLKYKDPSGSQVGMGQILYWKYETLIKKSQTKAGTLTGAIGCITAFRRELYSELPANIIEDFTGPLLIIQKGFRVVFEPKAVCYELTTAKTKNEWGMRIRVIRGGMKGLIYAKAVLNPFKFPVASFQLISHKVLRWAVPIFMILIFFLNVIALSNPNDFLMILMMLQLIFYGAAWTGYLMESLGKPMRILGVPLYFTIVNFASLIAIYKTFTSELDAVWETDRS